MPEKLGETTNLGQVLHAWQVAEYTQHERPRNWYIVMISIGLLLVLYGIFANNFLFALIIILAGIILFLQSKQTPPQIAFAITTTGLQVGDRLYPYNELTQFYLIYTDEVQTLYVLTKSRLRPTLRISLMDQDPVPIRITLRQFLSEDIEKEQEPVLDQFARRWKIH